MRVCAACGASCFPTTILTHFPLSKSSSRYLFMSYVNHYKLSVHLNFRNSNSTTVNRQTVYDGVHLHLDSLRLSHWLKQFLSIKSPIFITCFTFIVSRIKDRSAREIRSCRPDIRVVRDSGIRRCTTNSNTLRSLCSKLSKFHQLDTPGLTRAGSNTSSLFVVKIAVQPCVWIPSNVLSIFPRAIFALASLAFLISCSATFLLDFVVSLHPRL
jgi:hypothetical protein